MTTRFRANITHRAGHEPAKIVQGRVVNINLVKWTIDVVAQYDRKQYFNIQVASPYLHHSNGEGIYVFPEVGATAMVCLPSDSSAPFVMAFVMASETIDDSSPDAPLGTSSHGQAPANATDASFAGGRLKAKPGDIVMRTRDGNFAILHRGGVLQLGSTELAQRIYIPLNNQIIDISENYEHHNAAGSIQWGMQDGPSLAEYPAQFMQTFRVFANDQYADVKVACGKVFNPSPEPDGGLAQTEAGVGGDSPIVFEVALSPKGFIAETGDPASGATGKGSLFKFTFDRKGNVFMRAAGNLYVKVAKKLTFDVTGTIEMSTAANMFLTAKKGIDIDGGTYTHVKGKLVRLGAGGRPASGVGDIVMMELKNVPILISITTPPPCAIGNPIVPPGVPFPATLSTLAPFAASIATGNNGVLL